MKKRKRILIFSITFISLSVLAVYASVLADSFFSRSSIRFTRFFECIDCIKNQEKCLRWWLIFEIIVLCISIIIGFFQKSDRYKSNTIRITDNIEIPSPAGEGQHGKARFLTKKEAEKKYGKFKLNLNSPQIQQLISQGEDFKSEAKRFSKSSSYEDSTTEQPPEIPNTRDRALYKKQKAEDRRLKLRKSSLYRTLDDGLGEFISKRNAKCYKRKLLQTQAMGNDSAAKLKKSEDIRLKLRKSSLYRTLDDGLGEFINKRNAKRYKRKLLQAQAMGNDGAAKLKKSKAKNIINAAGLVIDYKKHGNKEIVRCISDDIHSLVVGAPGSGKTRRIVIETITSLALGGESIIVTDPKGELYGYLRMFLEKIGYDVQVMDFQNTEYSDRYNPLQVIIDEVNKGNITAAQAKAWDLTSFLVDRSNKSEPIWTNGEMSIIAASILCVVYDNKDRPEFQNMTNVYWFIANMCKDIKVGISIIKPIVKYVQKLPDTHPAKPMLGIANVAPDKTAGSFYTSALTTLRLFTAHELYNITYKSDFTLTDIGKRKKALFFILPDQKTTFYPIVTLLIAQMYDALVDSAKHHGGRLEKRTNFVLDEFGNFAKITDFPVMLAVGRSYGLRFNLFLQSFSQLTSKYGKEDADTIKSNCQVWIGLAVPDNETAREFEARMGDYTTTSYSTGVSLQRYAAPSSSSNISLIGRKLLMASEIMLIHQPYLLLSQLQSNPFIGNLPDLGSWSYNRMLGLGDIAHNIQFSIFSTSTRTRHEPEPMHLWGIWNQYAPLNYEIS